MSRFVPETPFRGLGALLRSRAGLAPGCFGFSLLASVLVLLGHTLVGETVGEEVFAMAGAVAGFLTPLMAGGLVTFGSPASREQFVAGPVGAWSLPALVHVGSLTLSAALLLGTAPLLLGVGPHVRLGSLIQLALLAWSATWLFMSCLSALGSTSACGALVWLLVPTVWVMTPIAANYADAHEAGYVAWLWTLGGVVLAFLLAFPYVAWARARHHSLTSPQPPASLHWLGGLALSLWALGGALWAAPFLVLAGARFVSLRRRAPKDRRRSTSNLTVGTRLLLALVLPLLVAAQIGDAYVLAHSADEPLAHRAFGYDAPQGGRRAVLVAHRQSGVAVVITRGMPTQVSADQGAGRVVVLGPDDAVERVLPPRFAVLTQDSWSSDGRYLAVHDQSVGRVQVGLPDPIAATRFMDASTLLSCYLGQHLLSTLVYDTQSGELSRLPLVELRRGWTTPDELITHRIDLRGRHYVATQGGEAVRADSAPRLVCYEKGRARIEQEAQVRTLTKRGWE